jgi:hypothetical protein
VCKNLYIIQCIEALHTAPEYQKVNITSHELLNCLLHNISEQIHHSHFNLIMQQDRSALSCFYTLPKFHKYPLGWRPVAAIHASVLAIPQRILAGCLELVMKFLKELHHKGFNETRKKIYSIIENSLDVVLSRPKTLTHMYFSDIDSIYQNIDQDCVISIETSRAAEIVCWKSALMRSVIHTNSSSTSTNSLHIT